MQTLSIPSRQTFGAGAEEIAYNLLEARGEARDYATEYLDAQLGRQWTPAELPELESLIRSIGPGYHRSELRVTFQGLGGDDTNRGPAARPADLYGGIDLQFVAVVDSHADGWQFVKTHPELAQAPWREDVRGFLGGTADIEDGTVIVFPERMLTWRHQERLVGQLVNRLAGTVKRLTIVTTSPAILSAAWECILVSGADENDNEDEA